jgi:hypothetical protein
MNVLNFSFNSMTELKDLEIRMIQLESRVNDEKQISYEDAKNNLMNLQKNQKIVPKMKRNECG